MSKRLFLLILASFLGVINAPEILTAADTVALRGLDNTGVVETVVSPEPEPEPVVEEATTEVTYALVASYVAAPQMINYTVTVYSGEIVAHDLSYYDIYKTGNLVYGHNSGNLLGNLGSLNVGDTFTVTEGGVVQTYRVAQKVLFEKNDGKLQLNGSGSYMKATLNAVYMGAQYGVAVMTCAGDPARDKNGAIIPGDATHRLVIFANKV